MKGWTVRIRRMAVIGLIGLMVSAAGWPPGTVRAGNGPAGMDGDGSQTNPYVVTNRDQLDALRNMTTTPGTVFVLGQDIDLGGMEWEPIPSFGGHLDGQGHKITGLTITATTAATVGLIGTLDSGGEISNLTLDNVQITTGDGQFYVGALVGKNRGTVRNGRVTGALTVNAGNGSIGGLAGWNGDPTTDDVGSIVDSLAAVDITATTTNATIGGLVGVNTMSWTSGPGPSAITGSHAAGAVTVNGAGNLIGGLVGNNAGTVSDSDATGNVHLEDVVNNDGLSSYVGGLVGENQGSVQDSYATGNVSGKGGSRANYGGLVGYNLNGAIVRSHAAGGVGVANVPNASVGGLVGFNDTGEMAPNPAIIEYSYSKGQVEVLSSDNAGVGGLVGNDRGSVKISYAMGNVVVGSGDRSSVGGLVGIHDSPGTIENSYAEGAVQGGGSNFDVGGLVGDNWAGMVNSYAFGKVTTEPNASVGYVGGLIGYNEGVGTADGCYWDMDTSGQNGGFGANDNTTPPAVTGKSTSDMMQQGTFVGWDFTTIWGIEPGKSRPFLLALFSGGLAFEPPQYEMNVGESRDAVLSAQYSDGNRWHVTTWATVVSSDPGVADVAKVEPVWKVTGNQAGTATLTASFPNLADVPNNLPDATATVKVVSPSSGGGGGGSGPVLLRLVVGPESLELKVGESGSLQVYAEYPGGWKQDVTELATYRSSDPVVAEVDSRGRVTGKSPGTAEITVTYQGKTVQMQVTVQRVTPQGPDFTDLTSSPFWRRIPSCHQGPCCTPWIGRTTDSPALHRRTGDPGQSSP